MDEELVVDGDPVRLRQVVDNLIANAVVHGGSSDVTVHASRSEAAVHIVVSDAGPGIPTDQLDRIFDAGVRLGADAPGSGLGLALARAIARGTRRLAHCTIGPRAGRDVHPRAAGGPAISLTRPPPAS